MYAYNKYFDQSKHVLGSFSLQFFQNRCITYPIVIWNENPKMWSGPTLNSSLVQSAEHSVQQG